MNSVGILCIYFDKITKEVLWGISLESSLNELKNFLVEECKYHFENWEEMHEVFQDK